MQSLENNSALQLLHMRGHVLHVLSSWPCGQQIDPGWSIQQIVDHLSPVVLGIPGYWSALKLAAKTLKAIRGFASSAPGQEQRVLAAAIVSFGLFRKKTEGLCPIAIH